MLRIDSRGGFDLESVIVVRGIFKEAVEGIEHFVRQQKEEFPEQAITSARWACFFKKDERTSKDRRNRAHPRHRT